MQLRQVRVCQRLRGAHIQPHPPLPCFGCHAQQHLACAQLALPKAIHRKGPLLLQAYNEEKAESQTEQGHWRQVRFPHEAHKSMALGPFCREVNTEGQAGRARLLHGN